MMTFDRVLPELLGVCEQRPDRADVAAYCVVRDVRGRVRLIVKPKVGMALSTAELSSALAAALGAYFVGPVLSAAGAGETRKLAEKLFERAKCWPPGWPGAYHNMLGGSETEVDLVDRWFGIERTIGKEAWLAAAERPEPPWPLVPGKSAPIVTFHSFKGGVGRSTLVAAYALSLARHGLRVTVLDLDLEAPGLGQLFGVSDLGRGVLDVLIDHLATGRIDLAEASSLARVPEPYGQRITVYPAGSFNAQYLAKLARLDFSAAAPGEDNPVGEALQDMLRTLRNEADVVLLDSRAGLHDIAGISLHGLAHVDVLVFRGTSQGLTGLEQTLRTLGAGPRKELLLVETMLPNEEEFFDARRMRTRERAYDFMLEHYYPEDEPPQLLDEGARHDVVPVRRKEWLDSLDDVTSKVEQILSDPELQKVARRLNELCKLRSPDDEALPEAAEEVDE